MLSIKIVFILFPSFHLTKHQINKLMTAEGIDIWKVDQHGNVDFRISIDYFAKIQNFFSSCTILENVERLVGRSERQMKLQSVNPSDALNILKVDINQDLIVYSICKIFVVTKILVCIHWAVKE